MNLKKTLQKLAEEEAENFLTEEDRLYIQQLIQKDGESESRKPADCKKIKTDKVKRK